MQKIKTSDDVFKNINKAIKNHKLESLGVISLSDRGDIVNNKIIYTGTEDEVIITISDIIEEVKKNKTNKFIIYHNHPTGDLKPSMNDLLSTESIIRICSQLNFKLIDHLIVNTKTYRSMREYCDVVF